MGLYDDNDRAYMIHAQLPENISFDDIANIVIPALREELREKLAKAGKMYVRSDHNQEATNIIERAEAIAKPVTGREDVGGKLYDRCWMTGHQLNRSVRILREELYLVSIALAPLERLEE